MKLYQPLIHLSSLFLVLCFTLCVLMQGCSKSDSSTNNAVIAISDLLPRENEISNWSRTTGSDESWLATNASELQEKIDGGSELFTNHGFTEAAMQKYSGKVNTATGVECEVQIYDQRSIDQANAVFDDVNNTFTNPITPTNPPSPKSHIQKNIFSYKMKFTKQKYYVLITLISSDDKAQEVIEVFASNISTKIK